MDDSLPRQLHLGRFSLRIKFSSFDNPISSIKISSLVLFFFFQGVVSLHGQAYSVENVNFSNLIRDTNQVRHNRDTIQFVVTNCSKERPSSVVTKTLKNGILIPIATSKELHFNADFRYINFIKLSLTHQSYEPEKNCLILENRGKQPLKVIES